MVRSLVVLLLCAVNVVSFTLHSSSRTRSPAVVRETRLFAADDDTSSVGPEVGGDGESVQPPKATVRCPDCDLCDGSGRILGGIGTVLEWWPIKAYRPCPNLVDRGGEYVRSGQGLDEIAFGRDPTFSDKN